MHENFIALEKEKRNKIINAAMREFAAKGYKNASTNEIVKKAEISKGALFHYFSSKKDLFEFLYRYSNDFFVETALPRMNGMPGDVFERLIAFAAIKLEIALQYPDMADFMLKAFNEDSPEISGVLKESFARFSETFTQKVYSGIDTFRFKPGIDIQKALQIIWWVLEGYALSMQKKAFDYSQMSMELLHEILIEEIKDYFSLLKASFYKEEFLY